MRLIEIYSTRCPPKNGGGSPGGQIPKTGIGKFVVWGRSIRVYGIAFGTLNTQHFVERANVKLNRSLGRGAIRSIYSSRFNLIDLKSSRQISSLMTL